MRIKEKVEKLKNISLKLTTIAVSFISYWIGVSFSFFLWKLSTFFKRKKRKSYWLDTEEEKENYKSQY